MEAWIARFGYAGVLVGSAFEGETTILLAGIFAKLGYLQLEKVVLFSFAGTFLGDCFFFFLGKYLGTPFVERHEFLRAKRNLCNKIIRQNGNLILLAMRFLAGFRSVILVLLGCTYPRPARFLWLDAVIVFVWTIVVSFVGYAFANLVYIFVSDIKGYERYIIPAVLVLPVAAILVYRHLIKEKEEEQFYGD